MPWTTFLRAHREFLVATDFLNVEVCTIRGLVTHYILFFIDIANRAVKIAGITPYPDSRWMTQIARNLTDLNDGFLRGKRYLILDQDTKYSDAFRCVLVREGVQVIRLPPRSPNMNAFAERFVRSIKEECLSRMIFFGPASLQHESSSSWRTIIPSAITRARKTKFRSPHPSLPYPITLFNADSASAEYSATTIGPQPDESRFIFWTIRDGVSGHGLSWLDGIYHDGVDTLFLDKATAWARRWKTLIEESCAQARLRSWYSRCACNKTGRSGSAPFQKARTNS
jgi:transposase InsO family protein